MHRWQIFFLQDNDVLPAVFVTHGKGRATRIQTVQEQTDRQAGKPLLQPLGQAVKGFEFTILLLRKLARILNELGQQGKDQPVQGNQLGFQHGMIVDCLPPVGSGQAMGTVPLWEGQSARAIHDDQEVALQQPIAIQHFLADQGFGHARYDGLKLIRVHALERSVHRVAMRTGRHARQHSEVIGRRSVPAQLQPDLPARLEVGGIHQNPRQGQRDHRVENQSLHPGIGHPVKQVGPSAKEMLHGARKGCQHRLFLVLILFQALFQRSVIQGKFGRTWAWHNRTSTRVGILPRLYHR